MTTSQPMALAASSTPWAGTFELSTAMLDVMTASFLPFTAGRGVASTGRLVPLSPASVAVLALASWAAGSISPPPGAVPVVVVSLPGSQPATPRRAVAASATRARLICLFEIMSPLHHRYALSGGVHQAPARTAGG